LYDFIQISDNLAVAYFLGHPVYIIVYSIPVITNYGSTSMRRSRILSWRFYERVAGRTINALIRSVVKMHWWRRIILATRETAWSY